MKKYLILLIGFFGVSNTYGQFVEKCHIIYEKKVNTWKLMQEIFSDEDGQDNSWLEMIKKNTPQFSTKQFDFYLDKDSSLYQISKTQKEETENNGFYSGSRIQNIVFTDLVNKKTISKKTIDGDNYFVTDSCKTFNWKITTETRNIGGFECRKATTIMFDSIYVVAFYTDQIISSCGPEQFNGLPGQILGVALPKMHITWFATSVNIIAIPPKTIVAPKATKMYNYKDFNSSILKNVKRWGSYGEKIIREANL
jgi:GLPGLI family protein